MINNKRIFIFTSTRADYGVQRWIIKELQNYSNFDTFVLVAYIIFLIYKKGLQHNSISIG